MRLALLRPARIVLRVGRRGRLRRGRVRVMLGIMMWGRRRVPPVGSPVRLVPIRRRVRLV